MNDTSKSYGQVAYEAYCGHTGWKSLVSGTALPQWENLKPDIKAAWESSARAVIAEFVRRVEDRRKQLVDQMEKRMAEASERPQSEINLGDMYSELAVEAFNQVAKEVEK